MKKITGTSFIILLITLVFFSCRDKHVIKPDNPNDFELITSVKLVMVDASNNSIVKEARAFENPNGLPGSNITIDTIRLNANKVYNVTVYLLDESKNPVDTISKEVQTEKNDHQLFYIFTNMSKTLSSNLVIDYISTDVDSHGVPLGLYPKFTTTNTIDGLLTIVLKHQPGIKPTTGKGNFDLGDSDLEVVFPVKIQ